VQRAFDEHRKYGGARLILADQVGLGKTIQLALSAVLMALSGEGPVLIVVPRTILTQWQGELWNLLGAPSAYWNGKCWVDEAGVEHLDAGAAAIRSCPRRIGIISQGLVFRKSKALESLKSANYECVIVDEAHRARRRGTASVTRAAEANNLLQFIRDISPKTRSLLLATATPVQMHLIEAWDLLEAIGWGRDDVLGDRFSPWADPERAIAAVRGEILAGDDREFWQWMRNPFPPSEEESHLMKLPFAQLRLTLGKELEPIASVSDFEILSPADKARIRDLRSGYFQHHNPFIRKIVRRTRKYLEETIDPETGLPYLQKVEVRLFGESASESLELPAYMQDAYNAASRFCAALGKQKRGTGFLETLLLRRIGSSMIAGKNTALVLLKKGQLEEGEDASEEEEELVDLAADSLTDSLDSAQLGELTTVVQALDANKSQDPKVKKVYEIVTRGVGDSGPWLARGCMIFSQYYDSAAWLAEVLSRSIPEQSVGLYAGSGKSRLFQDGFSKPVDQDFLKQEVSNGKLKLLVGTDAASEGLNLQTLGTLINLDLPWNPTRLEQRKGRIQRIGQKYSTVFVYNMRYRDSVEDKVHEALSERLQDIFSLFGQIPDTLSDAWVDIAFGREEDARKRIKASASQSPFDIKYNGGVGVGRDRWERCTAVLEQSELRTSLARGW
jgi:superfamily II DNA or RNA helicase